MLELPPYSQVLHLSLIRLSFSEIESKASKEEGKKSMKEEPAAEALLHRGEAVRQGEEIASPRGS